MNGIAAKPVPNFLSPPGVVIFTTCTADSPEAALSRLESMFGMGSEKAPPLTIRERIASAIQLIVQQSRGQDGSPKITRITEIQGMQGENIILQDRFRF